MSESLVTTPVPDAQLDTVWQYLSRARWFSGKGRDGRLVGVQALDWIGPADAAVRVRPEISTIGYPDGSVEYYQVLASYRAEPLPEALIGPAGDPTLGHLHDAARDPEAMALVVDALLAATQTPTWQAVPTARPEGDLTARVFTGEQSNTNVMLGEVALLKVFRKLEPGRNLDIQVHDALGRAGVASVARLYGWLAGSALDVQHEPIGFDLMMMVEQLRGVEDGWELALEHAREGRDFSVHAAHLGRALRVIHDALVDTFPTENLAGDDVADTMRARLDIAARAAPVLDEHRAGLLALFSALSGRRLRGQRIHGDFHLGQTLHLRGGATVAPADAEAGAWRIIDFEGEPMKQMWERLLPDSPWRDVAGMMRSFSYATSASPDPTGPAARQWLADCRRAFLDAYAGGRLSAADAEILAAYEADKAVYEVVYEARNRPDWLAIPLGGIRQLTGADAASSPT